MDKTYNNPDYQKHKTMVRISKRENPYLLIDKHGITNEKMSWKAKGLLSYLLSLPDDWQIYLSELTKHAADGKDSTAAGLKELEKFGYCKREPVRNDKGQFSGYMYTIFEIPNIENHTITIDNTSISTGTENPLSVCDAPIFTATENPLSDNPDSENPPLLSNNNTNSLITKSVSQSIKQEEQNMETKPYTQNEYTEKKTDRQTDNLQKEIENLFDNMQFGELKKAYPKELKELDELDMLIIDMYLSNEININGKTIPQFMIHKVLSKLTYFHLEYILQKFNEIAGDNEIKNVKAYMQSMIYNTGLEFKAKIKNEAMAYKRNIV